ncbi:MAG: nucleotide exchange factor GrpE [Betaproteobacteria bacterium]|nr:nucleotide exchange factor GrpE [Betaproteobacteria bacterium]
MQHQEPAVAPPSGETPASQPEGAEAADTPVIIPSAEEVLKQAELLAQEHHDAWLRAKAEADNVRKRAQADIANAHKYALEGFSSALVPVKDSLEAALNTENITIESLLEGVELTLKQLNACFEKSGIKEINPAGEKFDPHRHQAMTAVESDQTPNTVLHVFQKGYMLNDRILRPALVTVSKAKA